MNINSVKPQADLNKNAFDRSRRDVYSLKPAMLVPSFVEDTIPDAVYNISDLSILRTEPIQSAPFARMTRHTEYYYVPYSQLFRDFERVYYERGEVQRNVGNIKSVTTSPVLPTFDYGELVHQLFIEYCMLQFKQFAYSRLSTSAEHINFEYIYSLVPQSTIRSSHLLIDVHGRLCVEDSLRILDMLGYGNLLPFFKKTYQSKLGDIQQDLDSEVQTFEQTLLHNDETVPSVSAVTSFFDNLAQDYDVLYFPDLMTYRFNNFQGRKFSIFRLAAYLKIWSDMYRNSQYDVDENYAYYFNFDFAVSEALADIDISKVLQLLIPRYRQWKKDIYTGTFPTAQFGSTAVAELNNPSTIVSRSSLSSVTGITAGVRSSSGNNQLMLRDSGGAAISNSWNWNINSSVSAIAVRQALAFQRYKETILRAGNRTPALQRAVFGDTSRYIENNYVDFLGAWSSSIDFNNVAATAEGENQNVGQLSSNGVSVNSKNHIKFHSHDFGIIFGMTYILPEAEYNAYMIDPQLRKTESFDFYKPDFMNIGLSEIFNFDLNFIGERSSQDDAVIGYLPRYWEYKCAVDKVHGEFYSGLPEEIGFIRAEDEFSDIPYDALSVGAFSQFVTPRVIPASQLTLSRLYVSPDCVDNIFYVQSNELQMTDQFKLSDYHEVKALLPMSVLGLPQ